MNNILLADTEDPTLSFYHQCTLRSFGENFVKLIENRNPRYLAIDEQFNKGWNERYGNVLGSACGAYILTKNEQIIKAIQIAFTTLLENKDWSVYGSYRDEVSLAHLTVGIICSYDILQTNLEQDLKELFYSRMYEVLQRSKANDTSENYCNNIDAHNHTYWILLLRYLTCRALLLRQTTHPQWDVEFIKNTFSTTLEQWNKNLEVLEEIKEGEAYEGASYTSYSAMAIVHFLHSENLRTGKREFKNSIWLRNYSKYIEATYDHHHHTVFNIGDAPPNWSYGPETQLSYIKRYLNTNEGDRLLKKIEKNRILHFGNNLLNRNANDFLYVGLFKPVGTEADPKSTEQEEAQKTLTLFDNIGVAALQMQKNILCVRYGVYGGRNICQRRKKNIGHSYPAIGGFYYSNSQDILVSSAFYQKPKSSALHPVPVFELNGKRHEQAGCQDGSIDWLDSRRIDYQYSPLQLVEESDSHICLHLNNLNYDLQIKIERIFVLLKNKGLLVLDRFSDGPVGTKVESSLTNPYNTFEQDGNGFRIGKDSFLVSSTKLTNTNIQALKVHEANYTLSKVTARSELDNSGKSTIWFFLGQGKPPKDLTIALTTDNIEINFHNSLIRIKTNSEAERK